MTKITAKQYLQSGKRRFGTANPERMHEPVWEWMVRTGENPYGAHGLLGIEYKIEYGDPFWCFDRFGAPKVKMPDGRSITIAGEHEDFYDPDFCIYNDVFVRHGDRVEIFGYPKSTFPPTDFHSATLVDDRIVIVGCLGYPDVRGGSRTPVYRLNTDDYRIEPTECSGDSPGWIYEHKARFVDALRVLEITGGKVLYTDDGAEKSRNNVETYHLSVDDWVWQRVTDHSHWRQFVLSNAYKQDSPTWSLETGEALRKLGYPCDIHDWMAGEDDEEDEDYSISRVHILHVHGVEVICEPRLWDMHVMIQGELSEDQVHELIEKLKGVAWAATRVVEL